MFAFSQIQPRQSGISTRGDISTGSYLSTMAEQGVNDALFGVVGRMTEDFIYREGEILRPEEANKRYGIQGQLNFDSPIYAKVAELRNSRKRAEMLRHYTMEQGSHGFFSGRTLTGLGVGLVASMSNPLDFGLAFLPVTGSLARAKQLEQAGMGGFRVAMARGLITEEAIAATRIPAPRLFSSMIAGTVSQTAVEIPLAIQNYRDQANYGVDTFFTDIALGGLFSGGLHLAGTALERAFKKIKTTSPDTQEAMFRQALDQALRDEPIRVAEYVKLDEAKITAEVDAALRLKALESVDMEKLQAEVAAKYKETVVAMAIKYSDGTILEGPIHAMIDGPLDPLAREGAITNTGRFISREEMGQLQGKKESGGSEDFILANKGYEVPDVENSTISERNAYDALIAAGESPTQASQAIRDMREAQAKAAHESLLNRPEVQAEIAKIRDQRVQEFMEKNRPEEVKKTRDTEIRRQVQEGKILTPADAVKWEYKTSEDAKTSLDEEISTLEKDLKTLDPEELKSLDEAGKGFVEKAVELLERLKVDQDAKNLHLSLVDIPLSMWNGAIDAVIGALKAGKKIAEAVELGAQHIRDNWDKATAKMTPEKRGTSRRDFLKKLGMALGATQVPIDLSRVLRNPAEVKQLIRNLLIHEEKRYGLDMTEGTGFDFEWSASESLAFDLYPKEPTAAQIRKEAQNILEQEVNRQFELLNGKFEGKLVGSVGNDFRRMVDMDMIEKAILNNDPEYKTLLKKQAAEEKRLGESDELYKKQWDERHDLREKILTREQARKEAESKETLEKLAKLPDSELAAQLFREHTTQQLELERQHLAEEAAQVEASDKMPLGSGIEVDDIEAMGKLRQGWKSQYPDVKSPSGPDDIGRVDPLWGQMPKEEGFVPDKFPSQAEIDAEIKKLIDANKKKVDPQKQTDDTLDQMVNCLLRLRK